MLSLLLVQGALAGSCGSISVDTLAAVEAPAIIVLGERHGKRRDLKWAARLVDALEDNGVTVTVGLEAVRDINADALTQLQSQPDRDWETDLNWEKTWGYKWSVYQELVQHPNALPAGPKLSKAPENATIKIPAAYDDRYRELLQSHKAEGEKVTDEELAGFNRSMAWRDQRIAALPFDAWDSSGILLIVTGRGHVVGRHGTPFQLEAMTDLPVYSALLAKGDDCEAGDVVLRR